MMDILQDMENDQIKPDEQTLNNVMIHICNLIAANSDCYADAQKTALSALAEFHSIGIEPSLGAYENLLKIFNNKFKSRGKSHTIIFDIIGELEKKQNSGGSLKTVIPDDFNFFREAIFCVSLTNNLKLAYRTYRLLLNEGDQGTVLLGDYKDQNSFYK